MDRRETMNKLRMLVLAALAAATVAVGALAAAPSASAQRNQSVCDGLKMKAKVAGDLYIVWQYVGNFQLAKYYLGRSAAYYDAAADCYAASI
jgi:hypothetical protein